MRAVSLYGNTSYGDYGIFAGGGSPEPATDTPFPSYYGIQTLSYLGKAGDRFVGVTSSQSLLGVHAVRQAGGNLALLLINRDPANSYAANVSVTGFTPAGGSTDYTYNENSGSGGISSTAGVAGASFTRTLPPYSLTTVVMHPGGGAPSITSATTASDSEGASFSYQIVASNGPTSYGVQGLPGGLGINASTGLISGAPKFAGTFALTLNAYNNSGKGSSPLTLTVAQAPPVIMSAKTANGEVGGQFSYQIAASNGPTSYGVQGLPGGLSINSSTGLLSGTPKFAGTFMLTLNAYNAAGKGSETFTLTVTAP